jgi:hypothetical protein
MKTVEQWAIESRQEAIETMEKYNRWLQEEEMTDTQAETLKEMIETLEMIVKQYDTILA